jgi:hypothetical protein
LFASLALLIAAAKKGKCLGRCGASSRHTTKLEQFIFFIYIYGFYLLKVVTMNMFVTE